MKLLLPNKFKRLGLFMAPFGFVIWLAMQMGYTRKLMHFFMDENNRAIITLNIIIAVLSFFSFLLGICFLVFAKEKIEDELIQKTRLDSFQFAALVQLVFISFGFLGMFLFKEPDNGGLTLFFILLIFIFWLSFIGRFNYMIHVRIKQLNEKFTED